MVRKLMLMAVVACLLVADLGCVIAIGGRKCATCCTPCEKKCCEGEQKDVVIEKETAKPGETKGAAQD